MDFNLDEEHRAYADSVSRFAHQHLAAGALERAHATEYPWETARLLADNGFLGIAFPEGVGSPDTILCPPGFNTKPFTHDHK